MLDIECMDRIYLNAYVPNLQSSGAVVTFIYKHLGMPVVSPAVFERRGTMFRQAVTRFAENNDIPLIKFAKGDRKLDVMRPHLEAAAGEGRSRVTAIGVAQEFQRVWEGRKRDTAPGKAVTFTFAVAERRVTCCYFYAWDKDFGAGFIKVCSYFPYPAKVWVNGHEWAKRQMAKAGIGFTELSNGFASCEDPAALQAACDRLGPGHITVFFERWASRIPLPLTKQDRDGGYWRELSMRQVEVSRTIVFDDPAGARAFFEALVADNLDLGRPENVEMLFARAPKGRTGRPPKEPPVYKTAIDRHPDLGPWTSSVTVNAFWKKSRVKQYLKDGRALRIETVVNSPDDLRVAAGSATLTNSRPGHVKSMPGCCTLKEPARNASSIVQPLRGYRGRPSPGTAGGHPHCGSATLERRPWPAPWPAPFTPSPASRTRACAP